MNLEELRETDIWQLYSQSQNYARRINMYTDTDRNFRMYNGNQWEGLKISGIEPVQLNFIRPIVRYKVGSINQNLWAIHFSSENFENKEFLKTANKVCELLNKKVSKIWENDSMDYKIREISKNSAINDECPVYINYDKEKGIPSLEILSKNDIYYGNENDSDMQSQPYILIKQRKSVIEIRRIAEQEGVSKEEQEKIIGDTENFEESGEASKYEKDNNCTIITKLYKYNGKIYYSKATRYVDIKKDTNSGLNYLPAEHMLWEAKEGSARGEGEVRNLIANQLEVNKTLMRRALVAKNTAYPQKIVKIDNIQNPNAVETVGGTIKVKGTNVDDVKKAFSTTTPAQMSTDVKQLQQDLIDISRSLAGASDAAAGDTKPDEASGKAILAVQQASQLPLVEQLSNLKRFVEGIARIYLDMIITYNPNGIKLEEEVVDPNTGEEITQLVEVPGTILQELQATAKVDITPKSSYDKYAQELSLENLLKGGYFNPQRIPELKLYAKALPDDSTMPKQTLLKIIEDAEQEQMKIAQINAQSQMMIQNATNFINNDIDTQAQQINENAQALNNVS